MFTKLNFRFVLLCVFIYIVNSAPATKIKREVERPPDVAIKAAHAEAAAKKAEKKSNTDQNANVHVEIKSIPTDKPKSVVGDSDEAIIDAEKEILNRIDNVEQKEIDNVEEESKSQNEEQKIFQEGMIDKLIKEESEKQLTELAKSDDSDEEETNDSSNSDNLDFENEDRMEGKDEESSEESEEKLVKPDTDKKEVENEMNDKYEEQEDDVAKEIEKLMANSKTDESNEQTSENEPYVDDSEWYLPLLEGKDRKDDDDGYDSSEDYNRPFPYTRRRLPSQSWRQKRAVMRRSTWRMKRSAMATEAGMSMDTQNKHSIRSKRDVPYSDEDLERVREWLRENSSPEFEGEDDEAASEPEEEYYDEEPEAPYSPYSPYSSLEEGEDSQPTDDSESEISPEMEYEIAREIGLVPAVPEPDTEELDGEGENEDEEEESSEDENNVDFELDESNAQPLIYNGQPGVFVPIKKRQMLSTMPGIKKRNSNMFYSAPDAQEGRWRGFVPQSAEKRGVMEEYSRLYRLARALRKPQNAEPVYWDYDKKKK